MPKRSDYTIRCTDIAVAAAVIVFGIYFLIPKNEQLDEISKAQIHHGDKIIKTISLDKDANIDLLDHGLSMKIEVLDGRIRILSSDCKQQICVSKGFINKPHDPIICLPNKVIIEIKGNSEDYDAISR